LKQLGFQTSDLFNFINKESTGFVTRQDFKDMLNTAKIKGVSDSDVEKFIEGFYKEERGDIDLRAFIRIFEKYERQIEAEDNPFGITKKVRRKRIEAEVLKKK
jgi:Ca2+-binding EF-hand superfamily protein